jgi:3-oxoisoapionate-4-phosphate decarboxylase
MAQERAPDDVIRLTYRIETAGDPHKLAAKIASDQSTGTFVAVPGETPELKARVAARVVGYRDLPPVPDGVWPDGRVAGAIYRAAEADIDYPLDAIGTDFAALTTIAVGGASAIRGFSGFRVTGLQLPPAFATAYPGPQFGTPGTRMLTGVKGRPVIGTIVKPALGLRPHETAALVKDLVEAEVDFIKDDEKLMSPAYSPLAARVAAIMPIILDHEQKTGKKVMYAFNISSDDPEVLVRNHDIVAEAGGNAAVICINAVGYGGLKFLRKRSRLALHAHRAGWDAMTRHPSLGLEFSVYQQFWRLLGIDQFQINGIRVKYWEPDDSFVRSFKAVTTPLFSPADCPMPVVCSGQWGGQAPDTYARTGQTTDLLYLCGGGVVSHPGGPAAGVKAVQQAWDATVAGVPLDTYAKEHQELAQSLAKFGASDAAA